MNIVACDLGYGYVKQVKAEATTDDKAEVKGYDVFPSFLRRVQKNAYGIEEHPDYVETEKGAFLVGSSADSGEELRVRDPDVFLERLPVLLARAAKFWSAEPDVLVLGTPFQEWKRLSEPIVAVGEKFAPKVLCYPQAAAAAVRFSVGKPALVLDIGFNTVDAVPLDANGKVLSDRGVSWDRLGISRPLESLRDEIRSALGITLSPLLLERALARPGKALGTVRLNSDDFADFVRKLLSEYAFDVFTKILDRFGGTFEVLLPVGGGAKLIGKQLKTIGLTKNIRVKIPEKPELANVKGFLLLGLSAAGFEGTVLWPERAKKKNERRGVANASKPSDREVRPESDDSHTGSSV